MLAPVVGYFDHRAPSLLRMFGWRSRWAETSRGRLHYFDVPGRGSGPPFVLVHGLGSRAADYAILVRRLRSFSSRILLPDLPGHGWSPGEAPGADDMRAILTDAMDTLLPEPSYLLGNSLGGLVAVRLALAAPERIRGLVLASPAGAPFQPADLERVRSAFTLTTHGDALRFVDRLLGPRNSLRHLIAAGLRTRLARPAVRAILGSIDPNDLLTPGELSSLTMPVYFFWGSRDRILADEQRMWFTAHLPGHSRFENPDGYGHSPFLDHPGRFARSVRDFAEGIEGRTLGR